jgi:cell division protease FtsH
VEWKSLCRTLTPGHDPVQKVTLVPRGQARGLTWFIPMDDPTLISRQQLFARIVGGLGGRAAEEVIFGEPEVTTGAAGDLQQITGLAKQVYYLFYWNFVNVYVNVCKEFASHHEPFCGL